MTSLERPGRRFAALMRGLGGWLLGYADDRRAAVSPMMVFALVPLIGALAVAAEAGDWYLIRRNAQAAADAAAVAAATNGDAATTQSYIKEAKAVTAQYGFAASETAADTVTCPSPLSTITCYRVSITKKAPLYLLQIVGITGDTTTSSGAHAQTVRATALARASGLQQGYCIIGLGSTNKDGVTLAGMSSGTLGGCNLGSNSDIACNGANPNNNYFGAGVSTSVNSPGNSGCGPPPFKYGSQYAFTDPGTPPYSGRLSSSGISKSCGGLNNFGASTNWSSTSLVQVCGDMKLTGNISTSTASGGTVVVIYDGNLNLNGMSLTASGGGGLTIVFAGSSASKSHIPTGSGTLDFSAPSSGNWSGMALYQDPATPNPNYTKPNSTLDITYNGNNPILKVTGLLYAPNAFVTVSGAIDHATGGRKCFSIVAQGVKVTGNGSIFDNPTSECSQAGLNLPGVPGTEQRLALVQ